jgi:hypothetical protein
MNGSLDVSGFVDHSEGTPSDTDGNVPAPRASEHPEDGVAGEVHRARLAVARGARDRDDCRLLLNMLGLAPDEDGIPPIRR